MAKSFVRAPKTVSLQNAAKAYVSSCCSVLAEKPAARDNEGCLGTWRCSGCRKVCKVSVVGKEKYTKKENNAIQELSGHIG